MTLSMLAHRDDVGLKDGLLLIGGQWRASGDGVTWTHRHPATHEEIGSFAVASAEDVDAAVKAARTAFDDGPWPRSTVSERVRVMHKFSELLRSHNTELLSLLALDNGVPVSFGNIYAASVGVAADVFEHHAGWIDKAGGETFPGYQGGDKLALTFREPIGVVAAILPWNAPFLLFAQKLAPALAAGCTVVLKPSEYATFSVLRMVELLLEAGLPEGVVNVVTGPGDPTGEALITHPLVDKISFTGSRTVGKHIVAASASTLKRVSMELGGKSPAIVFPDAEIPLAAATAMGMVTMGLSGQACIAQSRALVHRDCYDEFLGVAQGVAGYMTFGDPFDPAVLASPLINEKQLARVLGYIQKGQEEGARLVVGGNQLDGDYSNGNFVAPTLFADVENSMTIAQEEIFGPVLAVVPFSDEEEAIRLANDTEYGLGAGVYTTDAKKAFRVAKRLRAGSIGINGYQVEPHLPFGGYRQSGIGREGGRSAYEAYTELKSVVMPLTEVMM